MANEKLFEEYQTELLLRVRNKRNLYCDSSLITKFQNSIGDSPPSASLVKGFLSGYSDRSLGTMARYTGVLKRFMKWYGEPMDDFKVKAPKKLPEYIEDADIEKLFQVIENKKSHRKLIPRDKLILELYLKTGMRRNELADLAVGEVHADFLIVRKGKGEKDRHIPLPPEIAQQLHEFIGSKGSSEKVFPISGEDIGNRISDIARKAGLRGKLHTHSLRHKYAIDLLEGGANIRQVQELLGHSDLSTTQRYLAVTGEGLREAVDRLGQKKPKPSGGSLIQSRTVTLQPMWQSDGDLSQETQSGTTFSIPVESSGIMIDSIQVTNSDVEVPFQLMIFVAEGTEDTSYWGSRNILPTEMARHELYSYIPPIPLPYADRNQTATVHGAICIGQRPRRFDLDYQGEAAEIGVYHQAPVTLSITLRYHPDSQV